MMNTSHGSVHQFYVTQIWVGALALLLSNCVTLSELLNFSESRFPSW